MVLPSSYKYIKEYGDAQDNIKSFSEPKGLEASPHWKFSAEVERKLPPTFVAILPGGRVWGPNGVVITPDNKLLWDVSPEYGVTPEAHSIFQQKSLPRLTKFKGTVAVVTFCSSQMYYHWMFDTLARLALLRRLKSSVDKIVINFNGNLPFQLETLGIFGISRKQIIKCHRRFHLQADRLVVPSLVGYSGQIPGWACNFLRTEFLAKIPPTPLLGYERIYISREKAQSRRIINEAPVAKLLAEYGFKKLTLESMSVAQQIRLFSSAEVIVSAHGSGLTNLLFSKPGTKVLEFFSPNYVNVLYWTLSNHLNLDYYYLIGEGQRPKEKADPHLVGEDISINLNQLKEIITIILNS